MAHRTEAFGTQGRVRLVEEETGNTVAWMEHRTDGAWWAWSWEDGEALLRDDFAGKTLEEVVSEAEDWV